MHCPKCGVEVVEEAGFCHKCGARIDMDNQPFPSASQTEPPQEEPEAVAETEPSEPAAEPARSPAEKFRETTATRQAAESEPERELWEGGYSSKAMIGAWALSGLITVVALIIWIMYVQTYWLALVVGIVLLWGFQFLKLLYRQWNIHYHLTTQRFIHETGILRRVTNRIEVIDMDDITYEQSFLERFVRVGTIRIESSDRTDPVLVMPGIEDVKTVAGMIDENRRSERMRRGLHIESI